MIRGNRIVYVRKVMVRGSRIVYVRKVMVRGSRIVYIRKKSWLELTVSCVFKKGGVIKIRAVYNSDERNKN
jgi:hypothetical protein